MNETDLEKILKAVANQRRLKILKYLKRVGSASVGDITEEIKLSFKSTSKHLAILFSISIVEKEQINLSMFYFLSKSPHPIVKKLLSIL